MTPAELKLAADAFCERTDARRRETEANLYNLACLIREAVWAKKMPDFERLFPKAEKKTREQSDDEMFKQAERLCRLFGGEIKDSE